MSSKRFDFCGHQACMVWFCPFRWCIIYLGLPFPLIKSSDQKNRLRGTAVTLLSKCSSRLHWAIYLICLFLDVCLRLRGRHESLFYCQPKTNKNVTVAILKRQLCDGVEQCYYGEDETHLSCRKKPGTEMYSLCKGTDYKKQCGLSKEVRAPMSSKTEYSH